VGGGRAVANQRTKVLAEEAGGSHTLQEGVSQSFCRKICGDRKDTQREEGAFSTSGVKKKRGSEL